jgi:HEAT repeat protein/beta-lactamase regulating signal transducer with metallopeptidase domain
MMTTTFTTILDLILRVSLLFGAAALLSWLLRRGSAATRHLVWTLAIAGSLALPLAMFAPRVELPLLPAAARAMTGADTSEAEPANSPVSSATARAQSVPAPDAAFSRRPRSSAAPIASRSRQISETGLSRDAEGRGLWGLGAAQLALIAWSVGFVAVLLRLALGTARMRFIARRARPLSGGPWLRLAERLAGALGVRHRVIFLEGARSAMPMTWGILRPRVLLPEAVSEWPASRQRVVLLHELAHVKRRDCLTQLLAQAACALYWFNPLAWLAARRLRAEREHACDDLVLASGTRGSDYADHLLEIARSMRSVAFPTWAAVAMAHRSQLEGRLMAILDPEVPRRFPTRRRSVALAATVGVITVPIALITPVPRAAEVVTNIESSYVESQTVPPPAAPAAKPQPAVKEAAASPATQATAVSKASSAEIASAAQTAVTATASSERFETTLVAIGRSIGYGLGQAVGEGIGEGTGRDISAGIGDAIGQAVGGVAGGVQGGVQGGVKSDVTAKKEERRDPRAVAALVEALKDSDKEVREHAMAALSNMRAPEALDAIRSALKDQNPSVREQAAFALGQYRDRASVDALAAALKDTSGDVREQAVFALGQIGDARASDAIAAALKDADASVREQAAFALGQIRHVPSVDALAAALKDASASVREQAAFALGQIGDRRAIDPLIGALRDESVSVREQAAFALGQIGDPRAIDGLMAALKDASAEVRRQAAFALGQLGK